MRPAFQPILLDGDTGYGNFNNMRRLVRKLEQRDIAAVCIEDKVFPKTNSFIGGEQQELADMDEFCGKIAAGKDSQQDDDFSIVARVEAYIAGWDTREALRRAEAYRAAGADAILIHSALSQPDQILEFAREWANRGPLVIVPTKYYSTPTDAFRKAGISLAIWANHLIRGAVDTMQVTAKRIYETETLVEVEDQIASVKELFRLQGAAELEVAERRYLKGTRQTRAVVLAASRGDENLADLTGDKPKTMLPLNGKPLLRRLVEGCKNQGVDSLTVVAGYRADTIDVKGIEMVENPRHASTGELGSLRCAVDRFTDDMVILYGDVLFRGYVLGELLDADAELTIVVDSRHGAMEASGQPDYVFSSAADDRSPWDREVLLRQIDSEAEQGGEAAHGRWIGLLRVRGDGRQWLIEALQQLGEHGEVDSLSMRDLLNHLVEQGRPVRVMYIHGHWIDVNSLADLERAGNFTARDFND